jgi:hypothetical protein
MIKKGVIFDRFCPFSLVFMGFLSHSLGFHKIEGILDAMYCNERDLLFGTVYDPPKILWDEADKYAIIAYLLLSLDKKADKDGMVRFDDLFGLDETVPDDGEEAGPNEKQEARDAIIRECDKFLAGLDEDSRYDCVADEIDRFIDGEDNYPCNIGGSYTTFGSSHNQNRLDSASYRLWDLVLLVVYDADYEGNKKRLLKHLSRKWGIEQAVLSQLESAAKALADIEKERESVKKSDRPYREVCQVLAELENREKETWKILKKMGIAEDRNVSTFASLHSALINSSLKLAGLKPDFTVDLNEIDEETDEDDEDDGYEEPDIGDKIAEGILNVADGISNVINDLAMKISGL